MDGPSPVDIVSSNVIPFTELITHHFRVDRIQGAFEVCAMNEGVKVIINPRGKEKRLRAIKTHFPVLLERRKRR
jgi:hypothetical protein